MRKTWAVCKREFMSYFTTPIGYVVVGTFALISGLSFRTVFLWFVEVSRNPAMFEYNEIPDFEETILSPFLVFCGQLILFIGPLISMRLLAEERNRGTMELLLTHPLRDRDIIFGKYLASLGMVLIMLICVIFYLGIIEHFAQVEPAVLAFGLLTVFLMAAAFMSLGLFVSAVTSNQITAATVTFGLWFVFWVLGSLGKFMPEVPALPLTWPQSLIGAVTVVYGVIRGLAMELPLDNHAKDMAQGVFTPKDVAYYILFSAFFLFLTFRALESRKWRA
ncbi:MAG: ABC transporter permease subunit [Candidatus Hydrogenedentes bacterium]|nr:ABC transporter permease subunit [Candidatus Hydrogenedentota bacterium]